MLNLKLKGAYIPEIENSRFKIYNNERAQSLSDATRITTRSGNVKTVVGVDITISRFMFGYMTKNIIPLAMCVVTSACSFWISPQAVAARSAFGVTMMLVGIVQQQQLVAELPKVAYLTWMDYYGYICFCYLTFVLVSYAYVHSRLTLADQDKDMAKNLINSAINMDVRSRFWYPLSFTFIMVAFLVSGAIFSQAQIDLPMAPLVPEDDS
jgi:hypothetical protein